MITLRNFQALFRRYEALHRRIPLLPRKINASDGTLLARIETEAVRGNMHVVRGWTLGSCLRVATPNRPMMTITPFLPRGDVQNRYGGPLHSGFEFEIPLARGPSALSFVCDGGDRTVLLRRPWAVARAAETLRRGLGLLWAGLRGAKAIHTYFKSSDVQDRDRAKQKLKQLFRIGQVSRRDHLIALQDLGRGVSSPKAQLGSDALTIVLPAYNAFNLLQLCLHRVAMHTEGDWHLVAIEDGSSDDRVRPMLRDWARQQGPARVTLLENDRNLGFIKSVNRGFAEALKRNAPIVLLNSDALVPEGWARRLLAPLDAADVASVTPMSNDAEIMNIPVICERILLEDGVGDRLDAAARALLAMAPVVPLPTGVGFCMAISHAWLSRLPRLDTAFGRGYGEEVDWCRKIAALGGRHVGLPGLFVEHRGGESFGSDEKLALVAANGRIITERYPRYDAEVQEFIASDPLIGPRLLLGLASAATLRGEVPVYLCHSLGGGAEDAMMRQLRCDLEQGLPGVVLRGGGRFRYAIELHTPQGMTHGSVEDDKVLEELLQTLPRMHLIYVCGVGDLDAPPLPGRMVRWVGRVGARLSIEIHDFFPLSPSYTLVDDTGHFSGPPHSASHTDTVHNTRDRAGEVVELAEWQSRWYGAMMQARDVIVFSDNSRDMILSVWPELSDKIILRPHPPLHGVPAVTRAPKMPARVVGVLGNIGKQKGAEVLSHLSRRMSRSRGEGLVLIGNIDPTYPLAASGVVHGSYVRADITTLAHNYAIDCWLIPSIWPETFSFTTREALATGLPVWCFDLGAQAEALREAGQGAHVLPLPAHPKDSDVIMQRILGHEVGS